MPNVRIDKLLTAITHILTGILTNILLHTISGLGILVIVIYLSYQVENSKDKKK
jgi:hypothetical protein